MVPGLVFMVFFLEVLYGYVWYLTLGTVVYLLHTLLSLEQYSRFWDNHKCPTLTFGSVFLILLSGETGYATAETGSFISYLAGDHWHPMWTVDFISLFSGLTMMEGKKRVWDQHYENFRLSVIRGDLGSVHIFEVQSFQKRTPYLCHSRAWNTVRAWL